MYLESFKAFGANRPGEPQVRRASFLFLRRAQVLEYVASARGTHDLRAAGHPGR